MSIIRIIKSFGVKVLTSGFSSSLIKFITNNKMKSFGSIIDTGDKNFTNKISANIFWNIYEKAELRSVQKHLKPGYTVIELGSSLGVVSALIGRIKSSEDKLICIEANPDLISSIDRQLKLNYVENYQVINAAIGPKGSKEIKFNQAASTLNGKITESENGFSVPVIDLPSIIQAEQIKNFSLVSDIEGAEVYLIFENYEIFKLCSLAIFELHNTRYQDKYYSKEDLAEIFIQKTGMKLIDLYRHVYVFGR